MSTNFLVASFPSNSNTAPREWHFVFSEDEDDLHGRRSQSQSPLSDVQPPRPTPSSDEELDADDPSQDDPHAWLLEDANAEEVEDEQPEERAPFDPEFDPSFDIDELPPAFYEDPIIRNAYIRVFVDAAFNHATRESVRHQLENLHATFVEIERTSERRFEGLSSMARTLPTLERRLGINLEKYIRYFFVCDRCWTRHSMDTLYALDSPQCQDEYCDGTLYTIYPTKKRRAKRIPTKLVPMSPLKPALQRILLRPGKFEELNAWRTDEDEPGLGPPSWTPPGTGIDAFADLNRPMRDVMDGWGWRAMSAGVVRQPSEEWEWGIVDVDEHDQRFVNMHLGLVFMLNVDW